MVAALGHESESLLSINLHELFGQAPVLSVLVLTQSPIEPEFNAMRPWPNTQALHIFLANGPV